MTGSPAADEILLGCLGRAAEYYDVDVYGFGCASNHIHLLYGAEHALQMAGFQSHFNGNLARETAGSTAGTRSSGAAATGL